MTPLAWLVGLILPACGYPAAQGLPPPGLLDMAHLTRPASPNTALAAPAAFTPPPDLVTPPYTVAPERLFAAIQQVAREQKRTFQAAVFPEQHQASYVVRSAVLNFPDLVTAQVAPADGGGSRLILYSRSVYGYGDFGVNRRRVAAWLAALQAALPPSSSER